MAPKRSEKVKKCGINHTAKTSCAKCKNDSYYDEQQQQNDQQTILVPVKIEKGNSGWLRERLVTTQDIIMTEIILEEQPIFVGPGFPSFYHNPAALSMEICLGCCKGAKSGIVCSKCKWPMCSSTCEKEPWHAKYECELFVKNRIRFKIDDKVAYYYITILRILLLKQKAPKVWKNLVSMFDFFNKRSNDAVTVVKTKSIRAIITKTFGKVDCSKIKGIVQTLEMYGITSEHADNMSCVCLFESCMRIEFDCAPNVHPLLGRPSIDGPIIMKLVAATSIQTGQPLTRMIDHIIPLLGTFERQTFMKVHYDYPCKCARCSDPTELKSYISAYKCKEQDCTNGYLLATDPLSTDENADWCCIYCNNHKSHAELKRGLNMRMAEITKIVNGPIKNTEGIPFDKIVRLQAMIAMANSEVHPNHACLWELKDLLMEDLDKSMRLVINDPELKRKLATKLMQLGYSGLMLSNKIIPGLTVSRFKLMYYVAKAGRILMELDNYEGILPEVEGGVCYLEHFAFEMLRVFCKNSLYSGARVKEILEDLLGSITKLAKAHIDRCKIVQLENENN